MVDGSHSECDKLTSVSRLDGLEVKLGHVVECVGPARVDRVGGSGLNSRATTASFPNASEPHLPLRLLPPPLAESGWRIVNRPDSVVGHEAKVVAGQGHEVGSRA